MGLFEYDNEPPGSIKAGIYRPVELTTNFFQESTCIS